MKNKLTIYINGNLAIFQMASSKEEDIRRAITTLSQQIGQYEARGQYVLMELGNLKEQLRSFMPPSDVGSVPNISPSYHERQCSALNISPSYHERLCSGSLFTFSKKLPLHLLIECANYKIQNNGDFSCALAAEYAYKWISTCYPAMNPLIIRDAIIIRPYGEEPLTTNNGTNQTRRAVVPGMEVAIWAGKHKPLSSNWTKKHDPIWECPTYVPTYTARTGVLHTVLLVTTEEGNRVCLDLSIGQFREEELPGVMLYFHEGDGIPL